MRRPAWTSYCIFLRTLRCWPWKIFTEQAPQDLERLYQLAVAVRPELQAQLAMIQRDHRQVELARLAYFPNFNFSVDWTDMTTAAPWRPRPTAWATWAWA